MKMRKASLKTAFAALVLATWSAPSFAVLISSSSNNPLGFSWAFASSAGLLTGTGSMALAGFNSSILTVNVSLSNISALSSNRLTSFGFGIDPNATGVSFVDSNDGGLVNASMSSIPSLSTIEICAFGGPNCSGGGNGGILGGGSDSFAILLAGTWGSSVNIDPIGFKYQTGAGSFEFTTASSSSGTTVSEPGPGTLSLLGLGLLGAAFGLRRKRQPAS
jgi:MYXO-CTERM domain-containing protein